MDFSNNGFGWNDSVEKDSEERALVPEGAYNAKILWIEKGEFAGSAKLSACPKAIITMMLDTGDTPTPITTTILLHRKLEWKIKEFFRAVGRAKHGEPYKMNWDGLEGARLRVHVSRHTFLDKYGEEKVSNQVDKFYDYNEDFFPRDPDWLQEAEHAEEAENGLPF